jgi:hypothetical protein
MRRGYLRFKKWALLKAIYTLSAVLRSLKRQVPGGEARAQEAAQFEGRVEVLLTERPTVGFSRVAERSGAASAGIYPDARVIPSPKKLARRISPRQASSKIGTRSAKSQAVTQLVRARQRQARAAIWSPSLCVSATGGKAAVSGT